MDSNINKADTEANTEPQPKPHVTVAQENAQSQTPPDHSDEQDSGFDAFISSLRTDLEMKKQELLFVNDSPRCFDETMTHVELLPSECHHDHECAEIGRQLIQIGCKKMALEDEIGGLEYVLEVCNEVHAKRMASRVRS
jgi:hypothetical protein